MVDFSLLPEYTLEGKQLNKDEIISDYPWEFYQVGGYFFLSLGMPNMAAYVLRGSDAKPIGNFVLKGNGPGECLSPQFAGYNEKEDTVYLYDRTYHKISAFVLPEQRKDTLSYSFAWEHRPKRTEDETIFYGSTARLADGRFVSQRSIGKDSLFTLFDGKLNKLRDFGQFPLPSGTGKEKALKEFFGNVTTDGNTFYYASKDFAFLSSYTIHPDNSVTQNFAHTYVKPIYETEEGRVRFDEENRHAFSDIKINKDYIWTLYNGNKKKDYLADQEENAEPNTLILFSLDGIPLAKFKLPHKGRRFCFSKDGKILYHFTKDFNIDMIQVEDVIEKL